MRGTVVGLGTPHPLATMLPAYLQEDGFAVRLTQGLDDVVAPVLAVLDCLEAYVDPRLAPADFLSWLAGWVGAALDDGWDDDRRRIQVLAATALHRERGTVAGVRAVVRLATGGDVEVRERGGVTRSHDPTGDPTDVEPPSLEITVAVDDPAAVRMRTLEELVNATKPAHVPHSIQVVTR
jgi:phage tail-like protein